MANHTEPAEALTNPDAPPLEAGYANTQPPKDSHPIAVIKGQAITDLPKDLYIPPDALTVFLETFEGPLDLLLYLIKRQNLDIIDIDVSKITDQYMQYIATMQAMQFELAAEYLLMAAMLAEIKSRLLLPKPAPHEEDEEDPRAQLIEQLQTYERFKQAAADLDQLPRLNRNIYPAAAQPLAIDKPRPQPTVAIEALLAAFHDVLNRADHFKHHAITKETLSTRARMSQILASLSPDQFTAFGTLFTVAEGRLGVIVTFLAIMELIKESLIEMVQSESFGVIYVRIKAL